MCCSAPDVHCVWFVARGQGGAGGAWLTCLWSMRSRALHKCAARLAWQKSFSAVFTFCMACLPCALKARVARFVWSGAQACRRTTRPTRIPTRQHRATASGCAPSLQKIMLRVLSRRPRASWARTGGSQTSRSLSGVSGIRRERARHRRTSVISTADGGCGPQLASIWAAVRHEERSKAPEKRVIKPSGDVKACNREYVVIKITTSVIEMSCNPQQCHVFKTNQTNQAKPCCVACRPCQNPCCTASVGHHRTSDTSSFLSLSTVLPESRLDFCGQMALVQMSQLALLRGPLA